MKRLGLPPGAIARARRLRNSMTDAERTLWAALRESFSAAHWRRQVPLGRYIADFCSHSAKLVVEVDGGQHAGAIARDAERTAFLKSNGYRVLRFWNNDVMGNVGGVVEAIATALSKPN